MLRRFALQLNRNVKLTRHLHSVRAYKLKFDAWGYHKYQKHVLREAGSSFRGRRASDAKLSTVATAVEEPHTRYESWHAMCPCSRR
jgi:hypothetical protein